jgi:hypothetical protein
MSDATRYSPMVTAIEITTFRKIALLNIVSGVNGPVELSTFSTALNARKNAENWDDDQDNVLTQRNDEHTVM